MGRRSGRGAISATRFSVSARLRSSRIAALVLALSILPLAGILTAAPPAQARARFNSPDLKVKSQKVRESPVYKGF